jgi:hypothetical protein
VSLLASFFQDFYYVPCVIELYRVYSVHVDFLLGVLAQTGLRFLGPEVRNVTRGLLVPGLGR